MPEEHEGSGIGRFFRRILPYRVHPITVIPQSEVIPPVIQQSIPEISPITEIEKPDETASRVVRQPDIVDFHLTPLNVGGTEGKKFIIDIRLRNGKMGRYFLKELTGKGFNKPEDPKITVKKHEELKQGGVNVPEEAFEVDLGDGVKRIAFTDLTNGGQRRVISWDTNIDPASVNAVDWQKLAREFAAQAQQAAEVGYRVGMDPYCIVLDDQTGVMEVIVADLGPNVANWSANPANEHLAEYNKGDAGIAFNDYVRKFNGGEQNFDKLIARPNSTSVE